MTTLVDSFMADLEELDELSDNTHDVHGKAFNYDLDNVSMLQKSRKYVDIMQKVEDAIISANKGDVIVEEDDHEYKLIVDCNALSVEIEDEIAIIHNFIRDKYRLKFPELDSLVNHPIDYARVVKKIGNETDLTLVDLQELLPSAIIMVVSVTASTTSGKPLPEDVLQRTLEACDRTLALDSSKKKVVDFVESRMNDIAPNLSGVVGSAVAAKLMCSAGGLSLLANMPADNVRNLGGKRKNLAGFSTASASRFCYIEETDIFQSSPPSLRVKVCRMLANKAILAARMDLNKAGIFNFKEEICKTIEKLQELPPARLPKPLPVPDFRSKKQRGGIRHSKRKDRYQVTDAQKLRNRVKFGVPEESSLGDGLGVGYGMLGQTGSGKLRVSARQNKKIVKISKVKSYGSSRAAAISGLMSSSFAFTPVQGIELSNPQAYSDGTQSTYFSETGTFSKIKRQKSLFGV
ncbi:hypothetical protein KY285_032170 [Solanum tuberosum]|nr:hypothetical protein KY284_031394 [Solanum tuberosum]KAH0654131.1 hypothetical protein KY289_031809 [Solanum tuberosum]KAH0657288.1 hypothetical protein KY285_032170 [Solanum tuberosum]